MFLCSWKTSSACNLYGNGGMVFMVSYLNRYLRELGPSGECKLRLSLRLHVGTGSVIPFYAIKAKGQSEVK